MTIDENGMQTGIAMHVAVALVSGPARVRRERCGASS